MKAAVGRLAFAPDRRQMEVTDIRTGRLVFSPVAGKPVSYHDLKRAIEGAGYEIDRAFIRVRGKLLSESDPRLRVEETGQVFVIEEDPVRETPEDWRPGATVRVEGEWSEGEGGQVVRVRGGSP